MADRNTARLAAPLALLMAAVAVAAVIQASGSSSPSQPPPVTRTAQVHHVRHARAPPRSYVVQAGDTLSTIAAKTGVSLATIQRLNPGIDPQALQTGQSLKLSP
jgi:LysM repeat protein